MPLEVSYRGERFALEYGSGKRAALRLLPADPLAGVPADWRDAAPRLRRLRGLQLLLLMGLGTASVAAAGTLSP
jgi:hypothetical protein